MTCTGCTAKFGVFRRKEKSCGICKLSFCSKCLNNVQQQQILPPSSSASNDSEISATYDDGQRLLLICKNCATVLSKRPNTKTTNFNNCLNEKIWNGHDDSVTWTIPESSKTDQDTKTDNVDDLYKRLEMLKNSGENASATIDEEDVSKRLCALKGESASNAFSADHAWILRPKPTKTQAEEADDLLNEYQAEHNISSKILTPEQEIAQRLARLRGEKKEEDKPEIHHINSSISTSVKKSPQEHIIPSVRTTTTDAFNEGNAEPDLDEVGRLMRLTYDQCRKDAQTALKDEQIKNVLLKNPKLSDLKTKHPDKQRKYTTNADG